MTNLDNPDIESDISFQDKVSFRVARWVLATFAITCTLTFVMIFFMFRREDATFADLVELTKFPMMSIVPMVMLIVGFYLDRER